MAGRIKAMLDEIVRQKSGTNPTFAMATKTKLILKGLHPDKFTAASPDDPVLIQKTIAVAHEMGVRL
jgi:hypothetical protein